MAQILPLLKQALESAKQFHGGYSNSFTGAEELAQALAIAIEEFEAGNFARYREVRLWFAPTCDWDDLIGLDGMDLANRIYELMSEKN